MKVVMSDTGLTIVAGSDTTATTLNALFCYLLQNEHAYKRLQKEIDDTFPTIQDDLDPKKLAAMPFLSACINEALRLMPAVPSGSRRSTERVGPRVIGSQ